MKRCADCFHHDKRASQYPCVTCEYYSNFVDKNTRLQDMHCYNCRFCDLDETHPQCERCTDGVDSCWVSTQDSHQELERSCSNCKYVAVPTHTEPCKTCQDHACWESNLSEDSHIEDPLSSQYCHYCKHFLKPGSDEPCRKCRQLGMGEISYWEPVPSCNCDEVETGTKHDDGKPRFDLLPPEALFAAAEVFTRGAKKYGDRNWEKGIELHRLFASVQRHLWAWQKGEEINDEDFGLPHLHHALSALMMLVTLDERSK